MKKDKAPGNEWNHYTELILGRGKTVVNMCMPLLKGSNKRKTYHAEDWAKSTIIPNLQKKRRSTRLLKLQKHIYAALQGKYSPD